MQGESDATDCPWTTSRPLWSTQSAAMKLWDVRIDNRYFLIRLLLPGFGAIVMEGTVTAFS